MGKIYHLDLQTLLETFEGQTGVLQREFAKGITFWQTRSDYSNRDTN